MAMLNVTINKQPYELAINTTLQQVIAQLALPEKGCVFSINQTVIPKSAWSERVLNPGDEISLFQAIAGG